VCCMRIGATLEARRLFAELLPSLSADERANDRCWLATSLQLLGQTREAFEEAERALLHAQLSERARFWEGPAQACLALILLERGEYALAASTVEAALQSGYARAGALTRSSILQSAVLVHLQRDDLEQAKMLIAEAQTLLDLTGETGPLGQLRLARTLIGNLEGDPSASLEHADLVASGMGRGDSGALVYAAGEIERRAEAGDLGAALRMLNRWPACRVGAPGARTTAAIALTLAGQGAEAAGMFAALLPALMEEGLRPLHARAQLYSELCRHLEGQADGLKRMRRAAEALRLLGLNPTSRRDLQRVSARLGPGELSQVLDTVTAIQTRRLAPRVITVRLVGRGELLLDGIRVNLHSHTARAAVLLNLLHLQPELSSAQIAEVVFGENLTPMTSQQARRVKTRVSQLVLRVRRVFGEEVILRSGPQNSSTYQLGRARYRVVVDVDQLEDDLRAGPQQMLQVARALRAGVLVNDSLPWACDRRDGLFGQLQVALMEAIRRCEGAASLGDLERSVAVFGATEGVIEEELQPLFVGLQAARRSTLRGP